MLVYDLINICVLLLHVSTIDMCTGMACSSEQLLENDGEIQGINTLPNHLGHKSMNK